MRIAICDDEEIFTQRLMNMLDEYASERGLKFIYYGFCDGSALLASDIRFDIIFMDYLMKEKNGVDTTAVLRERNDETHVIFVSSYRDIVFDSMKVRAFRFLVKPVDRDKLFEALDSVINDMTRVCSLPLYDEANDVMRRVFEKDIIYAQAENNYTLIHCINNSYKYTNTLSAFEKLLSSDFFFRPHRSFIVNMHFIKSYSKNEIALITGEKVLLSRIRYKEFQDTFFRFLKKESFGVG